MSSKLKVLLLLLAFPFSVAAQTSPTEDATAVFDRFLSSLANSDIEGVINLFTEDALFWGTGSQTLVEETSGIREYFSNLSSQPAGQTIARALNYSAIELSEHSVLVSGMWEVIPAGQNTATPLRISMVLILRDNEWKIIQFHNSNVPD